MRERYLDLTYSLLLCRMLDSKFDGVATKNGLFDNHQALDDLEAAMAAACDSKNLDKIVEAWDKFEKENLIHLKKEEDIMMPKVMAIVKSGDSLKEIMTNEMFALIVDSPDLEFWIKYANRVLDAHPGDMPRARVFDHALWAIATKDQWAVWDAWIKEALTESRYAEVQAAIKS